MIKCCKNCGYIRKPSDKNDEGECPQCGAFYRKVKRAQEDSAVVVPDAENDFSEDDGEEAEYTYLQSHLDDVKDWCDHSNFFFRIPVLIFYFYVVIKMVTDHEHGSIFNGINMGIHEGGHPLFSYFGRWLHIAGGTILQLLAPLACLAALLKQRDYFGVTFTMVWFSTSLIQMSVYMADARALVLPLVTVGGNSGPVAREDMHDWHNLFLSVGLLSWDTTIAMISYLVGLLILFVATFLGCLLTWWMYQGFIKAKEKV